MSKADLTKKAQEVAAMFDGVAKNYDQANDLLSFGSARIWRKQVSKLVNPQKGQTILDLAAGTGASSAAFLKEGVRVVAADFSNGMLEEGRKRHPEIEFVFADATNLPFKDQEFDTVTISFGLRNVENTELALSEMLRVLKPGGRLVVCEFSTIPNEFFHALYRFYLKNLLPKISALVSKVPEAYSYLAESIDAWPKQAELAKLIEKVGYQSV
ncbi:MAG: bifunctional demethylmenaquinone methyltransferase/2-methoxy-6-polyprenyl-1,4-benzoquinol methylase UbiE, partial [Actinobacteria bacterium]|nr:bifunctional demethylmenaquinone methyltransferase/2-methoxy-6-polyprenyl-1,4-benzoquinol methylase UbiE [Actinomycetota bacterium]